MEKIVFVTHNKGKIESAKKYFKNIEFEIYQYELDEPRSDDLSIIAKSKVEEAFKMVGKPCIALDCGFFVEALNGFPKAFVNFSLDTIGIDGILKLMEGKENRNCAFKECLAYHDGKEVHFFYGEHKGTVTNELIGIDRNEKWSDLWYIFKPEGYNTTLANMSKEEREKRNEIHSNSAMKNFAKWYENMNMF